MQEIVFFFKVSVTNKIKSKRNKSLFESPNILKQIKCQFASNTLSTNMYVLALIKMCNLNKCLDNYISHKYLVSTTIFIPENLTKECIYRNTFVCT